MIVDINYPPREITKLSDAPSNFQILLLKLSDPFSREHTETVLEDLCGIDKEQFSKFHKNGIV